MIDNEKHLRLLERKVIETLTASGIHYVRNGGSDILPGILSLAFAGKDGEAILHRMD